jgi:hypothetical protein
MSKCYDNPDYDNTSSDIQNTWNQSKPKQEIQPQQIWNEEKKEGIKKLIQKQKLIDMMEQDEQLGLYEEPKYPIGGYAPGNYMCNCSTCKTQFQGDKRAVQCEPCAIKMTKEESKQDCKDCSQSLQVCTCIEDTIDMKQETPEEVAERLIPLSSVPRKWFVRGAKWQQERSYSEEEVLVLLQDIQAQVGIDYNDNFMFADKWFEQFKKK